MFCFEPKSIYPRAPIMPVSSLSLGIIQKRVSSLEHIQLRTLPHGENVLRPFEPPQVELFVPLVP